MEAAKLEEERAREARRLYRRTRGVQLWACLSTAVVPALHMFSLMAKVAAAHHLSAHLSSAHVLRCAVLCCADVASLSLVLRTERDSRSPDRLVQLSPAHGAPHVSAALAVGRPHPCAACGGSQHDAVGAAAALAPHPLGVSHTTPVFGAQQTRE